MLTLVWSALLLGETVSPAMIVTALAVVGSVAIIQRTRVSLAAAPATSRRGREIVAAHDAEVSRGGS